MTAKLIRHPLSPLTKRAGIALLALFLVMVIGTVGIKLLTPWDWVYSFYFMTMIATAEGPPGQPPSVAADIFIAVMAFVSIGTLITAIGTLFGPYLGYLFSKGVSFAEKELEKKKLKEGKSSSEKDAFDEDPGA